MDFVVFYVNFVRRGACRMEYDLVNTVLPFSHQTIDIRTARTYVDR